jgi:hypothetical protein
LAVLTSFGQLGGAVGDLYAGKKIVRVVADGKYIWQDADAAAIDDRTDLSQAPTALLSRKGLEDVLKAKEKGRWLPDAADIAARDAIADVRLSDRVKVTNDGDSKWAIYEARDASPSPNWLKIVDEDGLTSPLPKLAADDITTGTATTGSLIDAKTLADAFFGTVVGTIQNIVDPATVKAGARTWVCNDGANNGVYIASGAAPGSPAAYWVKG